MPLPKGKVAVFNLDGTLSLTGSGLLGTTEMANRSASLTSGANAVDLKVGGVVVTRNYTSRTRNLTITVNPYDPASPGDLATHKAKIKLPDEGSVVTLADWASPDFNGTWNFEGGDITPQDEGYLTMTFRLSRVGEASGAPASL